MKMSDWVRIILTACLIYMAYKETGIWTAICLSLITLSIELQSFVMRKAFRYLADLDRG